MQLSNLNFSNFKNWKKFNTDLKKINLFFGQNSSGKSSIIQLLLLLKQTIEKRDEKVVLYFGDNQSYVNLGNFDEIINRDVLDKKLNFGFQFTSLWEVISFFANVEKNENGILIVESLKISDNKQNTNLKVEKNGKKYNAILNVKNKTANINREISIENVNYFFGLPFHPFNDKELNEISFTLQYRINRLFENIIYIGPLREKPQRRGYEWTGSRHSHFGVSGENAVDAIITSMKQNEVFYSKFFNYSGTLAEIICNWLIKFNMADEFQIVPINEMKQLYQVNIKTKGAKNWVDICDVGFGVSQILPIIALCYYAPKDSIIIIEQPEIHLHPKVQSGLGDLLIDAALSRNIQFIVESHSEHLLTRIQRRIAEEKIDDKDIKINFCNLVEGESVLEELQVDDFGEIINWPENFFGDEMEEIYQMQNAILKRKMKMAQAEKDGENLPF